MISLARAEWVFAHQLHLRAEMYGVASANLVCRVPRPLGLLVSKISATRPPGLSSSPSIPSHGLGSPYFSAACHILYPRRSVLSRAVGAAVDRKDGEEKLGSATGESGEAEAEGERDWYLFAKQASTAGSSVMKFPLLTNKEKKELRAYAHGLGKKLVSQQVGKLGVTPALARTIVDVLEAKELIKLRVLDNCPATVEETMGQLEEMTGAQAVGNIGNTFILYRPSYHKVADADK